LLIVDLQLPGVDGLSLVREARQQRPRLPAIVITGHSNEESGIEAIHLGVAGYLIKPLRIPRVLAAAAGALGESEC
jgi:DNA-binding response OmpR family regulator